MTSDNSNSNNNDNALSLLQYKDDDDDDGNNNNNNQRSSTTTNISPSAFRTLATNNPIKTTSIYIKDKWWRSDEVCKLMKLLFLHLSGMKHNANKYNFIVEKAITRQNRPDGRKVKKKSEE